MTYGFRPENWPAFEAELAKRRIEVADIERFEIRPSVDPEAVRSVDVTVTLRSGRAESWRQVREEA